MNKSYIITFTSDIGKLHIECSAENEDEARVIAAKRIGQIDDPHFYLEKEGKKNLAKASYIIREADLLGDVYCSVDCYLDLETNLAYFDPEGRVKIGVANIEVQPIENPECFFVLKDGTEIKDEGQKDEEEDEEPDDEE